MKSTFTLSLCAATILCSTLAAQTIELDSVTVSASPIHGHGTFDVPAAVDVIDKEVIASQTTASLGKILSQEAGVDNISTGSQAGKPVIRGMSGERVKILSNGSATDFQTYGIRHLSNTDTFLADSMEVVRGAQGVLYGSDALGGVVNIISPKLLRAKEGETKLQGELLGEYHTNNQERAGGIKAQAALGNFGVNLGVVKRKAGNINTPNADTWEPGDAMTASDKPRFAGELPYTNYESTSAQIALGYTDDWGDISLQHTYWQSDQNYLGHTGGPNFTAKPTGQDLSNNETQLQGSVLLGDWIVKPRISRTLNVRKAATGYEYEVMNDSNIDLDIEVDRYDGALEIVHPQIGIFDGEIGIEGYTKKQTVNRGHLVPNADEDGKSIFIFEEADVGDWIGQAGLRYDTRHISAEAADGSKDFSALGGSLGLIYKITSNWNVGTNLSRGFRAPSVFELYADGMHGGVQAYQKGNSNLKEETTLGADLFLRYKNENTNASLTLYHNHVDNYIYLANTGVPYQGSVYYYTNEQTTAQIQGIEFSLESYLTQSTRVKGTFEIIDGEDLDNNSDLTMMPANNLSLALYQDVGSFHNLQNNIFSVNVKAYAQKDAAGSQEPFYQYNAMPFGTADTTGYTLWGLGYESKLAIMGQKAEIFVNVDNLFDTEYRNFLDTYKGYALGMGRNVSFLLRMPFAL